MNEAFYTEPFSDQRRDQINLATVGGSISFDIKGNACFHFPTAEARNEYLSLKTKEKGSEEK
ncbi:hypothetical protein P5664_21755 [Bacillus subtilis]|uniref:hypothetical protein n=1 Tax=Bacillus TaxID=1386 RepID=UPI000BB0692C|nr:MULTISPECIES: hypothetical protein [Bacillus subtilis group]ASZ59902.1 hypothetical protein CLD04_01020 [Bacillus subtilis]MED1174381.1 hypothetical protein [Bacillus inaquosorum]QGH95017.1 hypothetical protein GII76_01005 [Bacillus subtilis]QPD79543.1 hypothetical protein GO005_01005 [Bacillus subtilis]UNM82424.1 hypothetical protein MNG38_01010 [Bacillus subtilis]